MLLGRRLRGGSGDHLLGQLPHRRGLRAPADGDGLEAGFFYPTGTAYNGVITRGDTPEKRHDSTFCRDVWRPAQIASEMGIRPHEARHSYVSHLRRAGVDPADLADVTRHTIQTATLHYTHPTRQSYDVIRGAIG